MRDFYWFKRGGFILAVDAMNRLDAFAYVELHNGEMEYLGAWAPGTQYMTAACGITTRRQEYITRECNRHLESGRYDLVTYQMEV